MSILPALAIWLEIYQMERCSGRLHWHWQSWILCWQSFRARCLDGFIDIGGFNFRFSTSSSQSPFYLQAAESAFVTYPLGSRWLERASQRKKEDMKVASQAEDPKLYAAHSRSQHHRLKIQSCTWLTADLSNTGWRSKSCTWLTADLSNTGWRSNSCTCIRADLSTPLLPCGAGG